MLNWLKTRLVDWVKKAQRAQIARLAEQNKRLKEEIERERGRPIQLTAAERKILAVKGEEIDPEMLKKISVFDSEDSNIQYLQGVSTKKS